MKDLETMNLLELKGVLFDLNSQIQQIQNYAQTKVLPLIKKWEEENKDKIQFEEKSKKEVKK